MPRTTRRATTLACGFVLCAALRGQTYTAYNIGTFAGGGLPVNIPGKLASLSGFISVAVDTSGNIYFETGEVILRMGSDGILTHVAGNGAIGKDGDGGPAISAQLGYQGAIALDSARNIYITDFLAKRVRKISNGIITTFAGGGDSLADNVPATQAQLISPQGVAVDSSGVVYISEGARIRKVMNGVITTIAGNNGAYGFSGDGGAAVNAQLASPLALAVDAAGDLYFVDLGNNRVREISHGIISTVAGTGNIGYYGPVGDGGPATSADLNMFALSGLATDLVGNLYIATNNCVRRVSNGTITTVAGIGPDGSSGNNGDGGPATQGRIGIPAGVAVDFAGNLYFGDAGFGSNDARIRKVSGGTISTVSGGGFSLGDGGPAVQAQLSGPVGLALDPASNLYIADSGNNRVRRVSNGIITTVAGTGTSFVGDTGDGGPALDAAFIQPTGLGFDGAGNLLIADNSFAIRKVANGFVNAFAGGGSQKDRLNNDTRFVVAGDGTVYASDIFRSVINKISNGVISTIVGTGTAGYSGDNAPAINAQLSHPNGLALDSAGALYIADSDNGVIRKVANGIITTVASGFTQPMWIAFDSAGNLYVSDVFLVKKVSQGFVTTIAGGGAVFGDGGPATIAHLTAPQGIAADATGNVYFSDGDRVRVLIPYQAPCPYSVDRTSPGWVWRVMVVWSPAAAVRKDLRAGHRYQCFGVGTTEPERQRSRSFGFGPAPGRVFSMVCF